MCPHIYWTDGLLFLTSSAFALFALSQYRSGILGLKQNRGSRSINQFRVICSVIFGFYPLVSMGHVIWLFLSWGACSIIMNFR